MLIPSMFYHHKCPQENHMVIDCAIADKTSELILVVSALSSSTLVGSTHKSKQGSTGESSNTKMTHITVRAVIIALP